MVRCLKSHVYNPGARGLYIGVGNRLPDDHPAVLANPEYFDIASPAPASQPSTSNEAEPASPIQED